MKEMAVLGDVAEFTNGAAFKPQDWASTGYPIIRIQNLTDPRKPFNYTTKVVPERFHVQPGDLLVSWSATLGVFQWNGKEARLNQHIFRVVPDESIVDRQYLRYVLENALQDMQRHLHGATMKHINRKQFLNTQIFLPPLPEQKRLAAILDKAESLLTQRRAALEKLEGLAQAVFVEMFGDPVRNEKGWEEEITLGKASEIVSGITKGRKVKSPTREVPYLAVINVQDRRLDLSIVKRIQATEQEINRYRLMSNDLLLTEGGDPDKLGRGALWKDELEECIHQNHVFRVRITESKLCPVYLSWLVGSQRGKRYFLRSAKQTTGIASINMTQLRSFPLLLPPLPLQQEFARRVEAIENLKASHRTSLEEMETLFKALQGRAFRGEL